MINPKVDFVASHSASTHLFWQLISSILSSFCYTCIGYHLFDVECSGSSSVSCLFVIPSIIIYKNSSSCLKTRPIIIQLSCLMVLIVFLVFFISCSTLSFVLFSVQLSLKILLHHHISKLSSNFCFTLFNTHYSHLYSTTLHIYKFTARYAVAIVF